MTDKLVIVESPAKANTIKKFLGGNTKVVASMGHIRDLPKSKLGIDEKTLEPQYINIRGKGDLIKALKKDAKDAKKVYLATDPDRLLRRLLCRSGSGHRAVQSIPCN